MVSELLKKSIDTAVSGRPEDLPKLIKKIKAHINAIEDSEIRSLTLIEVIGMAMPGHSADQRSADQHLVRIALSRALIVLYEQNKAMTDSVIMEAMQTKLKDVLKEKVNDYYPTHDQTLGWVHEGDFTDQLMTNLYNDSRHWMTALLRYPNRERYSNNPEREALIARQVEKILILMNDSSWPELCLMSQIAEESDGKPQPMRIYFECDENNDNVYFRTHTDSEKKLYNSFSAQWSSDTKEIFKKYLKRHIKADSLASLHPVGRWLLLAYLSKDGHIKQEGIYSDPEEGSSFWLGRKKAYHARVLYEEVDTRKYVNPVQRYAEKEREPTFFLHRLFGFPLPDSHKLKVSNTLTTLQVPDITHELTTDISYWIHASARVSSGLVRSNTLYDKSLTNQLRAYKLAIWDAILGIENPALKLKYLQDLINSENILCFLMDIPRGSFNQEGRDRENNGTRAGIREHIDAAENACIEGFLEKNVALKSSVRQAPYATFISVTPLSKVVNNFELTALTYK